MPAAPFSQVELERLTALGRCQLLDTPEEQAFDDITQLASLCCQTPTALVSLVDHDRQWFKSRVGLDVCQTPRSQAFCGYTILGEGVLCIEDATVDPRTSDNPLVTGAPHIRFYAGVPVRDPSGQALGSLCVIDQAPRKLSPTMRQCLESLGRQVESQIALRLANLALRRESLAAQAAEHAKTQFLFSASQQLHGPLQPLLRLQETVRERNLRGDFVMLPELLDIVDQHASHMAELLDEMRAESHVRRALVSKPRTQVDLISILRDVCNSKQSNLSPRGLELAITARSGVPRLITTEAEQLRHVLNTLLDAVARRTDHGGITVSLRYDPNLCLLEFEFRDGGRGAFRPLLSQLQDVEQDPQVSTSRKAWPRADDVEIAEARRVVRELGGFMQMDSIAGEGSVVSFTIPIGTSTQSSALVSATMLQTEITGASRATTAA